MEPDESPPYSDFFRILLETACLMQPADSLYGVVKNGVLTLSSGPGASLKVVQNHLIAQDGGTELKFRRAACPVSRVVIVRSEGFITIPALRWLHEVGSALVVLQYDGTPIAVTVPPVIVPVALRRAQAATSIESRLGKDIATSLIRAKITGQISTLRAFDRGAAADAISAIAERTAPRSAALELWAPKVWRQLYILALCRTCQYCLASSKLYLPIGGFLARGDRALRVIHVAPLCRRKPC